MSRGRLRFYVELVGPGWFQLPDRPDAYFLVPSADTGPVMGPVDWTGWQKVGCLDDTPAAFSRPGPPQFQHRRRW
jgi:hypothetical protein